MDSIDKEHVWDEGCGYLKSAEGKAQREPLRSRIIGFIGMALVVLGAAAVVALYSNQAGAGEPLAGMRYSDPQVTLRLTPKPCTAPEVLKHLVDDAKPYYREAGFTWEGRPLKACWRAGSDGRVLTVDEEGDRLYPPPHISRFSPESGS